MVPATDMRTGDLRAEMMIKTAATGAYALGALALAGEAIVHLQQYTALLHSVRWIGPLFLVDAIACAVVIVGLVVRRTRVLAALAGVITSDLALASLAVSYGRGLFGWSEAGFRTPVEWAVITEFGAVILLTSAIAGTVFARARSARPRLVPATGKGSDDGRSATTLRSKPKVDTA